MLKRIVDAPPNLRKFLEARERHSASLDELKLLGQLAAEEAAARTNNPRVAASTAGAAPSGGSVIDFADAANELKTRSET